MSALTSFFYPLPAPRRTAGAVVSWWEQRRIPFNLIVGATGCATITISSVLSALVGRPPRLEFLLVGSVIYGVLANVCYCLGPAVELGLYHFLGDDAPRAGPVLFRQGLLFSIGLTLFPIALTGLWAMVRIFARVLG